MSRGYPTRHRQRSSPLSAFVLLLLGLLALVGAVLGPTEHLLSNSFAAVTAGGPLFDGPGLVVSGGLLVVSGTSIFLGIALLSLRS